MASLQKESECCEKCDCEGFACGAGLGHKPHCKSPTCPCHSLQKESEWENDFIEKGADIEHDRWSRWQKYMFSKGVVDPDGVFHLPEEFVDRWFRQIDTPYSELSESEKESDRNETRNYLPLISQILSKREKEIAEKVKLIKCLIVEAEENEQDSMDDAKQHGHDQACDKVLSILKH